LRITLSRSHCRAFDARNPESHQGHCPPSCRSCHPPDWRGEACISGRGRRLRPPNHIEPSQRRPACAWACWFPAPRILYTSTSSKGSLLCCAFTRSGPRSMILHRVCASFWASFCCARRPQLSSRIGAGRAFFFIFCGRGDGPIRDSESAVSARRLWSKTRRHRQRR